MGSSKCTLIKKDSKSKDTKNKPASFSQVILANSKEDVVTKEQKI